jgi:hypothetical protein
MKGRVTMTRGFRRFLRRNTIALLALFIALGGTTYAATALPKNSVGTKQLKKNAVTAVKIKNANVTNAKIANNAVTGAKVKDDSLTGADILESSLGKVPSATSADNATSAANATNATNATTATTSANGTGLAGPLAAGQTLRGVFEVAGNNDASGFVAGFDISYPIPLAAAPQTNVIPSGGPPTTNCPGTVANPLAVSGKLCIYVASLTGATGLTELTAFGLPLKLGTTFIPAGVGAGANYQVNGAWAVTG